MFEIMQARMQLLTLYEVRTHAKIDDNEQVDKLAYEENFERHRGPLYPYEYGHSTLYFLHKD